MTICTHTCLECGNIIYSREDRFPRYCAVCLSIVKQREANRTFTEADLAQSAAARKARDEFINIGCGIIFVIGGIICYLLYQVGELTPFAIAFGIVFGLIWLTVDK